MSDIYRIIEQQVGDWRCAVGVQVFPWVDQDNSVIDGRNIFKVRWWVVENEVLGKAFSWTYLGSPTGNPTEPEGHYPKLYSEDGGSLDFYMPKEVSGG